MNTIPFRKKKKRVKSISKFLLREVMVLPGAKGSDIEMLEYPKVFEKCWMWVSKKKKSRNNSDIWDPGEYMNK